VISPHEKEIILAETDESCGIQDNLY
jgi:hypothetical protein